MELYDVLNQIKIDFGNEVILEKDRFVSLLADLAPEKVKERRLIKTILELNVGIKLYNIRNCSREEQYNEVLKITKMVEEETGIKDTVYVPIIVLFCEFFEFPKGVYGNINSDFNHHSNEPSSVEQSVSNRENTQHPTTTEGKHFEYYLKPNKDGRCYYDGDEVKMEFIKTYNSFLKSNGSAESQYALGCCYEYGRGVRQNYKKARKWFLKSASQGYDKAKEELAEKSIILGKYEKILFSNKRMFYFNCNRSKYSSVTTMLGERVNIPVTIVGYLLVIVSIIMGIIISNNILLVSGIVAALTRVIAKFTIRDWAMTLTFVIAPLLSILGFIAGVISIFIK